MDGTDRNEEKKDSVGLHFHILSAQIEVREHYRIYDGNSFLADFGGFLGLLLGHSAFGVYCMIEDHLFSWINKKFQGKNSLIMGTGGAGKVQQKKPVSVWK